MFARVAALVLSVIALGASGCSYNPGYFPYLVPPGPIQQTHAKPRAFGYFRNFDPKACRLEVTPSGQATAPLGAQLVLVATVYDKDGQPRRDRRVEWMIDGPGNIVEADESGLFAGRGYKDGNKFAVTYTSYIPKTITRGNDDPKDDTSIEPGQTFVVISSAVPGETVVTAYAPAVFNWDNGRVVTKVLWGDGRFSFPTSTTARIGGETTLSTVVNPTNTDGTSGFRVRYRVIDGPTAVLVAQGGSGTSASQSGSGGKEAEAFTDTNGEAAVRLVQRDPQPGKTRVAVEVVKVPESGVGPGVVVGRRETVVEWALPDVKLNVKAPEVASILGTFPVTVSLENTSGVESKDARVKVTLSDGATLARSEPPPIRQDEKGALVFDLPPVGGKGKQTVTLQVKPARVGQVTVTADALTADGMQATTSATTRVEQGRLQLVLESPPMALAGERIPVRIAVTNGGAAPATNVTVWATFSPELTSASGRSPVELAGNTLAPGETKILDLPLTARTTGRYGLRATATGDGNLSASAEPIAVEVRKAELALVVTGPKLAYLNQPVSWTVTVANRGDSPIANAVVRATIPPEIKLTGADGGTVGAGSVEWKVSELKAGDQRVFKLSADAIKLTAQATVSASVLGDATSGGKPVGTPVEAKSESALAVIGTPAVSLELIPPTGLGEVGKRVRFTIRVKNQGTVSARNVEVTAFVLPELRAVRGTGSGEGRIDGAGRVAFSTLEELRPGQTVTYTIEADLLQTGDARVRVEVRAPHLKSALTEEQSIRVNGR
ncbi:MAG: hypothetical protein L0241_15110 [Planctomycetia bacterium]|nr:hypothetical protein [Planctomycetia bacterium]